MQVIRSARTNCCGPSRKRTAVIGAISRYVDQDVVARVLREVRKRLAEQEKKSTSEFPRLKSERAKLVEEIKRMAEAVTTSPNVKLLAKKLSKRQEKLNELDARIQLLRAAPNVIDLEVHRLEIATRERLTKLHETMRGKHSGGAPGDPVGPGKRTHDDTARDFVRTRVQHHRPARPRSGARCWQRPPRRTRRGGWVLRIIRVPDGTRRVRDSC
jgi:seryl-tRNA synthetase